MSQSAPSVCDRGTHDSIKAGPVLVSLPPPGARWLCGRAAAGARSREHRNHAAVRETHGLGGDA